MHTGLHTDCVCVRRMLPAVTMEVQHPKEEDAAPAPAPLMPMEAEEATPAPASAAVMQ